LHKNSVVRDSSPLVFRITFRNPVKVKMIICVFPCAMFTPAMSSEVEEDKKLDGKHAIEEAMSELSFLNHLFRSPIRVR
jgi:hypothetical protein